MVFSFRRCRQKRKSGEADLIPLPQEHDDSMFPTPGYPLKGCSPALPFSVSPGNCDVRENVQGPTQS